VNGCAESYLHPVAIEGLVRRLPEMRS